MIQLSETQLAEQSGFGTFQFQGADIQSDLGDAADGRHRAIHAVRLIEAGLVGVEGHGHALGLVVDTSDGFIDHILEVGVGVADFQGLAEFQEGEGTGAFHGVVDMLTGVGEVFEARAVAVQELQGAFVIAGFGFFVSHRVVGLSVGICLQLGDLLGGQLVSVDADSLVFAAVVHLGTQRLGYIADRHIGAILIDDSCGVHRHRGGLAVGGYLLSAAWQ